MTDSILRELTPADISAVIALWTRCGLTRPWNDPEQDIIFALRGSTSTGLTMWQNSTLIGAVLVGHDGHRGAVYYLGVDPEQQRKGFGETLMRAAEDWLRAQGVWKLNLQIRGENQAVLSFYKRLGFIDQQTVCLGKRLDGQADRTALAKT